MKFMILLNMNVSKSVTTAIVIVLAASPLVLADAVRSFNSLSLADYPILVLR